MKSLRIFESTGNHEMLRTYREITERMRIIRRLDFTIVDRIAATCAEHTKFISAIQRSSADEAQRLLDAHIEQQDRSTQDHARHALPGA